MAPQRWFVRFGAGRVAILTNRFDHWQAGYILPKGAYPQLRADGIELLRRGFAGSLPECTDRVEHLTDWRQVSFLSVESSRWSDGTAPGCYLSGTQRT